MGCQGISLDISGVKPFLGDTIPKEDHRIVVFDKKNRRRNRKRSVQEERE
jgi:hypothetical protein